MSVLTPAQRPVKRRERRHSIAVLALMSMGVTLFAACTEQPLSPPHIAAIQLVPPREPPWAKPPRVFPVPAHKPKPPEDTANSPETESTATASTPAAATEPSPSGSATETGSPTTVVTVPEPVPPAPNPKQLIGLDQAAAQQLLGAAAEKVEASPATLWRYRKAGCELDLFFYLDLRSGKMRTLRYALKSVGGGREECLRSFIVARRS